MFVGSQESWEDTVKKLEFMKCVAEADKKGTMMKYMLTMLWKLANQWRDTIKMESRESETKVSKEVMNIHLWKHVDLEV